MKRLFVLLCCSFAVYTAQAQVSVQPGVRAGLNLTNLANMEGAEARPDFYVGGMVSLNLLKFYTLQPEISYSRQGAKYEFNGPIPAFPGYQQPEENLEIQYLSISLMNKFNIVKGFHAVVGPSVDFKVGDNFSEDWYGTDIADIDFALHGGLGYTLGMGLTVEARYKMGLIDIFGYDSWDDNAENTDNYEDIVLNSVLQLGLSYSF